jgi:hypothetical protein
MPEKLPCVTRRRVDADHPSVLLLNPGHGTLFDNGDTPIDRLVHESSAQLLLIGHSILWHPQPTLQVFDFDHRTHGLALGRCQNFAFDAPTAVKYKKVE